MTQQDARERAMRLVERCARGVASAQEGMDLRGLFEDLWKRREEDEQRIAALVAAATEIASLPMLRGESGVGATYTVTYKDTGAMDRLDAALRALAGQTEEVSGGV